MLVVERYGSFVERNSHIDLLVQFGAKITAAQFAANCEQSLDVRQIRIGGTIMAVHGIVADSFFSREAFIWMVTTDAVRPRSFARWSRVYVRDLLARYSALHCVVDRNNAISQRWLQWLGFELQEDGEWMKGVLKWK